jgi:hypothetical protein
MEMTNMRMSVVSATTKMEQIALIPGVAYNFTNASYNTVELGYNVMKGTEYFVSL